MSETIVSTDDADLHDADFLSWTERQARAIEEGRWTDVDGANVAEEIASLGRQMVREVGDRAEILISYLLKWRHLAEYRGFAWKENISRQRREITKLIDASPTLAARQDELVVDAYENARRRLKYETYFFETDFPASCPFTVSQVLDAGFLPQELDPPAADTFPASRRIA